MADIFPTHLFNPKAIKVWLAGNVIQSGQSISGVGQVVRTDGGGFRMCRMDGIILNTDDKLRAWRAWQGVMAGGVVKVTVPLATNRLAPRPLQGGKPTRYGSLANSSSDPYFPEASGYGLPMIVATVNGAAAQRANQIGITMTQGSVIRGGETFSIAHPISGNRAYEINRVLSRTGDDYVVQIDCPLREALAGGEAVNFDWPMFDAYLLPDSDIAPMIENYRAEVSITFREAL